MIQFKWWQLVILVLPVVGVVGFLLVAAGWKIHEWGISWIWGIFTLIFLGWRWLLAKWTMPMTQQVEALITDVNADIELTGEDGVRPAEHEAVKQSEDALERVLSASRDDPPIWDDWETFWKRCQNLVVAIANVYHPEVKYPLLNIYVPQAYGLIRGTVDDVDQWMQKLSPVLNQVTVGQAYQAYEVYQKLEPSARRLWQVWNWVQWVINPAAAVARTASQRSGSRATQQMLVNLGQMLREAALRNLCQQAIALYGGSHLPGLEASVPTDELPKAKTQSLREILEKAEPTEEVEQKPVNLLLVGRTGAGKSSVINTVFQAEKAEVDVLPSTDQIQNYQWQTQTGDTLNLWDTPGYEQISREDFRELVLDYAMTADLLMLVTPALDPALQMDVDFIDEIKAEVADLPAIAIVTQVDRLRPIREWTPPYNWQRGDRPKEVAIREATQYRSDLLGDRCDRILPIVTRDSKTDRSAWNLDALSVALLETVNPAKQLRLARFLRDRDARITAAAKVIDRYTFQMATTQGLTAFLKSPVLQFISTLTTGSPTLAYVLSEQIPVEQLPVVIGKLQMAYDLFSVLNTDDSKSKSFELLSLWNVLTDTPKLSDGKPSPEVTRNAWALGHALVEYWTQDLTVNQLRERFDFYLKQAETTDV
ncbi:MAG: GTPase family protein [Elainellaceae cyanobacterium]